MRKPAALAAAVPLSSSAPMAFPACSDMPTIPAGAGTPAKTVHMADGPSQGRYIEHALDEQVGRITRLSHGTYRNLTFAHGQDIGVVVESRLG